MENKNATKLHFLFICGKIGEYVKKGDNYV